MANEWMKTAVYTWELSLTSNFSQISYKYLLPSFPDVLILEQFVEGDGRLMSRSVTGLCKRQQFRITKFVKMAQKAGLMPGKDLGWRQYSTRVPT